MQNSFLTIDLKKFYSILSILGLALLFVFLSIPQLQAQKQLPRKERKLVYDLANVLSRQQEAALESKLVKYNMETTTQIAVVIENSLEGEDAFTYTQRLAETWGIGGKENNNGILLFVSINDREMRIHTGYGAEGFLPDVMASRIIRNVLAPAFRERDYYGGVDRGTDIMMDLGKGEYKAEDYQHFNEGLPDWALILLFIALIIFLSWLTHKDDDDDGGYYRGGRYDMPDRRHRRGGRTIIIPGGGFGGGGGGFGGGGFGGFGGGGFGGGGAGGSW